MTSFLIFLTAITTQGDRDTGEPSHPDIVMIIVDDMNDSISLFDHESPVKTPNLEKLASEGVFFNNTYCQSPACNPSRTATLTGLNPTTSGVYGNKSDWKKAIGNHPTLMQHFRRNGYRVMGAGKVFHHHLNGAFHDADSFDAFRPMDPQNMPPQKLNGAPEYGSRNTDWGAWPVKESDTIDFKSVSFCIDSLSQYNSPQPLMMVCGIFKPHSPFFAPPRYHEMAKAYTDLIIAENEKDLEDLPSGAHRLLKGKKWFYQGMEKLESRTPGSWRSFINAYVACCLFADAQIGRLMDTVRNHPRFSKAIIVLWSDHGFHLGEKNHIEKFALWDKSTRVPFIISSPNMSSKGAVCPSPVDLSTLYPTLCELAGIEAPAELDGVSLVPLLQSPSKIWNHPALTTYGKGNHAVRLHQWRYIHYADGTEELYNLFDDPHEWKNLAPMPVHRNKMNAMAEYLPSSEAPAVGDLKRSKQ